ncbi:MAG: hypothetical protein KAT09_02115, partial [Candidatus Aegiribacteria sp.]|nr:hypothetical protein [Candidatus Aegiribacteria sp.]
FEVSTLRKLAIALGCRLKIEFISNGGNCRMEISKSEVICSLKRLFWDYDFNLEILDEYPVWAVERVLESGQLEQHSEERGYAMPETVLTENSLELLNK